MVETNHSRATALTGRMRLALLAAGVALAAMLVTATRLEPDPSGRGTHEQLGLAPCTFLVLFHRPCPSCGMTTAWAWLARGCVREALAANSGGTLLAVLALVGTPWLLASAAAGRWFLRKPGPLALTATLTCVVVITLVQWAWRLLCR